MADRWTDQDVADYMERRNGFIQSGTQKPVGYVMTINSDPNWRHIVIPGVPCPKPRQTKSDKWKQRPSVMKYRAWADEARKYAGQLPAKAGRMDVVAYFPLTKGAVRGLPHLKTPDGDNLLKACADALFPKCDSMIHEMRIKKRYDDGSGPRVEITIY